MICAWQELVRILPPWLRESVDNYGREDMTDLRLRMGQPPMLVCLKGIQETGRAVVMDDLNFVVNTASRYSPWAAATVSQGYITAPGGHRIGIFGEAVTSGFDLKGIRNIRSLCIRVARDHTGIAAGIPAEGSVLIIGPPGAGKTTLLRDLIRTRSEQGKGSVSVVDERGELFPGDFSTGRCTDILTGCSKQTGINLALRTMGPGIIAVDEITEEADAKALTDAAGCGVVLLATAHARTRDDLLKRPVYRSLMKREIFQHLVILQEDKSWRTERIGL